MRAKLKSHAAEIVTIVFGILIAFALDSGWDATQDRRQESRLLLALAGEVDENVRRLDGGIDHHGRLESNTGLLLELMMASELGDTIQVADSLLFSLMGARSMNFAQVELEGAAASGGIDLITDPDLRTQIATLASRFADLSEDEILAANLKWEVLIPGLSGEMELAPVLQSKLDWSQSWLGTDRWVHVTEETRTLVSGKAQLEYWILLEASGLRGGLAALSRRLKEEAG